METWILLLLMCSSVFCLEAETIKASVKAGKNKFKCTFKLVRSDTTVDIKNSKLACSPKKKKGKVVGFKLEGSEGTYILDFTINPSKLKKAEFISTTTSPESSTFPTKTTTPPKSTTFPTPTDAKCSLGFTNVCTKPLDNACPEGMESKCPSTSLYTNSKPDSFECTCLPTVAVEQALSSEISPLGSCFDACVCLPISSCSSCSQPPAPSKGQWYCTENQEDDLSCTLECDLGYISGGFNNIGPTTVCNGGVWSLNISSFECGAAVALITGGTNDLNDKSIGFKVETYSGFGVCSEVLPDMPVVRMLHSLNLVGDQVILCGGDNGDMVTSKCFDPPTCLKMDIGTHLWTNHSNTPGSMYGNSEGTCTYLRNHHMGLVHHDSLVLLGGMYNKPNETDEIWDGTTWKNYNSTPYFWSYGACATKISRDIYMVMGGQKRPSWINDENDKRVLRYNLKTNTVTQLPDLQIGRIYEACTFVQNSTFNGVLLAGKGDTELYDLSTNTSTVLGKMNIPRSGHMMMVLGEKIVAMGGHKIGNTKLKSVEEFNMTTQTWTSSPYDLRFERNYAAATPFPLNVCY